MSRLFRTGSVSVISLWEQRTRKHRKELNPSPSNAVKQNMICAPQLDEQQTSGRKTTFVSFGQVYGSLTQDLEEIKHSSLIRWTDRGLI